MDAAELSVRTCKQYDDERKFSLSGMVFNTMGEGYYEKCVGALGYDPDEKLKEKVSGAGVWEVFKENLPNIM